MSDDELRPRLAKLAQKRLLASNTLASSPEERVKWDEANAWLATVIDAPLDLCLLNTKLGGDGVFRTTPIFTGPNEYLGPERIEAGLTDLERRTDDVFFDAAVTYITVVTVHPFANANGRTARLAADHILLADGALPLCFLSPIASHVAQLQTGIARDPMRALGTAFAAIAESYATVLG